MSRLTASIARAAATSPLLAAAAFQALSLPLTSAAETAREQPNVVIVYTDEHNFRTLGCYRDLLPHDQAYIWGEGVEVETPHLDSLARDGAISTSFYPASPVCTPSRASFMTGRYPHATGAPKHNMPLDDDTRTFATVLHEAGYQTAYFGKWHLDGPPRPGWAPERKFGWENNKYMWNRGHWKMIRDTEEGPELIGEWDSTRGGEMAYPLGVLVYDMEEATPENYTTDYLTDKAIEAIEGYGDEPFCVMISLPDPHGPNEVRAPYDTMYDHFEFEEPKTFHKTAEQRQIFRSHVNDNNFIWEDSLDQESMADYFGMVKCIDDNVGKLLAYLKEADLEDNTIFVFTSDHGDLMGEHRRHNKSIPLEGSAKVAFLARYPDQVPAGKRIHTVMNSVDFAPTVLALMGIENGLAGVHGRDRSERFTSSELEVRGDSITYLRESEPIAEWVASVSSRYKLTLSTADWPWFVDLEKDPSELTNLYDDPEYSDLVRQFKESLKRQMEAADDPSLELRELNRWL